MLSSMPSAVLNQQAQDRLCTMSIDASDEPSCVEKFAGLCLQFEPVLKNGRDELHVPA